jgi:hypothetical protein
MWTLLDDFNAGTYGLPGTVAVIIGALKVIGPSPAELIAATANV